MPNASAAGQLIAQLGFPVFVAVILLLRVDHMHAQNIRAIDALTQEIALLRHWLERNGK